LFCLASMPFKSLCRCITSVHQGQYWTNTEPPLGASGASIVGLLGSSKLGRISAGRAALEAGEAQVLWASFWREVSGATQESLLPNVHPCHRRCERKVDPCLACRIQPRGQAMWSCCWREIKPSHEPHALTPLCASPSHFFLFFYARHPSSGL